MSLECHKFLIKELRELTPAIGQAKSVGAEDIFTSLAKSATLSYMAHKYPQLEQTERTFWRMTSYTRQKLKMRIFSSCLTL